MLKKLNIEKIDFNNYKKIEFKEDNIQYLEQDISRAYDYLTITHKLEKNEKIVLRALRTSGTGALATEHIVADYEDFKNFVIKIKNNKDATYDIYYNIFNFDKNKMNEFYKEHYDKMLANSNNVSSTSILEADFDGIAYSDYLKIKEEFQIRGIETIDKWSGHGVHIVILLNKNCKDFDILKKWIITLQNVGLNPDIMCKDCARLMRLPYFNNTKTKYETITRCEVICNTNKRYDLEDVFQRFGQDYAEIKIDDKEVYKKVKKEIKEKVDKKEIDTHLIELESINKYYYMDFNVFPLGIRQMLRGLRNGYSNMQIFFLTVYFKKYYKDETIKYIIQKLEEINKNDWNTWSAVAECERFLEYDVISKFDLMQLQTEFGKIEHLQNIDSLENKTIISKDLLKFDEKEIKLYLGFKYNKITYCKSSKMQSLTNIKKSSLYNLKDNLFIKRNNAYFLNDNCFTYDNFIILENEKMEKLLFELDADELKVYLYLKYLKREKTNIYANNDICIKQEEIAEIVGFTRQRTSDILKSLLKMRLIIIHRGYFEEGATKEEGKRIADSYVVF